MQALKINILGVNSFGADPSIELRPEINIEYKSVQMVVSSESDIKVPDLISELQSSGHIIEVQCDKSSGIISFVMTYNNVNMYMVTQ